MRSVRRPARPGGKGEPARAAEGGVEAPPAALIAAWLERDVLREGQDGWEGSILILPSRENSVMSEGGSTGRMRSGMGGLWRSMAGRAGRVGGSRRLPAACFERLPLLGEGRARVRGRRARQPLEAAADGLESARRWRSRDRGPAMPCWKQRAAAASPRRRGWAPSPRLAARGEPSERAGVVLRAESTLPEGRLRKPRSGDGWKEKGQWPLVALLRCRLRNPSAISTTFCCWRRGSLETSSKTSWSLPFAASQ